MYFTDEELRILIEGTAFCLNEGAANADEDTLIALQARLEDELSRRAMS